MSADWLNSIQAILADSLGGDFQKSDAYQAALKIDAAIELYPPKWQGIGVIIRRGYQTWCEQMRYMLPALPADHHLPDTIMRSDAEVANDYGLRTQKGVTEKQMQIAGASETRVQRALDHLAAGWPEEDVLCFVASRAEWRQVQRRAKAAA